MISADILIRNASLADGRTLDIAIDAERISALGANLAVQAKEIIDARKQLVSAPFVDPHFHMDATLSYGQPRVTQYGTLLEGITLWSELKETLTIDAMIERAMRYCELAVRHGLLVIRSHVDVCDDRLLGV